MDLGLPANVRVRSSCVALHGRASNRSTPAKPTALCGRLLAVESVQSNSAESLGIATQMEHRLLLVCVHLLSERAHSCMTSFCSLQDEIAAAFQAAKAGGSYDPGCYMMANSSEYWAEGSQAWFEATVREGEHLRYLCLGFRCCSSCAPAGLRAALV